MKTVVSTLMRVRLLSVSVVLFGLAFLFVATGYTGWPLYLVLALGLFERLLTGFALFIMMSSFKQVVKAATQNQFNRQI